MFGLGRRAGALTGAFELAGAAVASLTAFPLVRAAAIDRLTVTTAASLTAAAASSLTTTNNHINNNGNLHI